MPGDPLLSFGLYQLDLVKMQLWCETQPVRLTPKALQVLCYVVARAGQLVTKEELFEVVWADTVVGDAALTMCIQEIRRTLQDNARKPQYLETVHRRGFRFIALITTQPVASRQQAGDSQKEGEANDQDHAQGSTARQEDGPALTVQTPPLDVGLRGEDEQHLHELSSAPLIAAHAGLHEHESLIADNHHEDISSPLATDSLVLPAVVSASSRFTRGLVLAAAVLLMTATVLTVQYLSRSSPSPQDSAPRTDTASQALPLPDKPSLIVLPLVNLSGDPAQEYFSDGLTEVLTGNLSTISNLFVIARNSAFTYKGKAVKVQDVGREMGVRYVLEGSVQKVDQRVRITTQLIDATTGYQVWAEQYDRPLTDIFALQDEIVRKIVTTLKLQLSLQEQGFLVRKTTANLEAYDYLLRGREYSARFTKEANTQARQLFEKALELDPQYAEAYAMLSTTYYLERFQQWSQDPQVLERALALAQQAVALDDSLSYARYLLSQVYLGKKQYEQAITEAEQAIALDPNGVRGYVALGIILNFTGQAEKVIGVIGQALRLDPRSPFISQLTLGWAYFLTRRYEEAIAAQQKALGRNPNSLDAHLVLTLCYSELDRAEEARAEAAEVLRLNPKYSLAGIRQTWPIKDPAQRERILTALGRAGLK